MKIFISYRRDDSAGYAGRLFEYLTGHFGARNVFMDIDTIEPGEDFRKVVRDAVVTCDVVLVLMGKHWLGIKDGQGLQRLDDPNDWVRAEIATALTNPNVRVIPVLVRGASMPAEHELPLDLKELSWRNALELSDSRFQHDAGKLISVIERTGDRPKAVAKVSRSANTLTRFMPKSLGVIGVGLIISLAWIGWKFLGTTPIFTSAPSMSPTGTSAMTLPTQSLLPTQPNASPGSAFQRGDTIQHTVTAGESLLQIARCYGVDFEQLRNVNPQISDPRSFLPDMAVVVPNIGSAGVIYGPPCVAHYVVKSGDTWESIAIRYNAHLDVLRAVNTVTTLEVGQFLIIPSNSAGAVPLPPFSLIQLAPYQEVPYSSNSISPGQVMTVKFTNTSSGAFVILLVDDPNEEEVETTDDIMVWGVPIVESGAYEIRILNKINSTITYRVEVNISD